MNKILKCEALGRNWLDAIYGAAQSLVRQWLIFLQFQEPGPLPGVRNFDSSLPECRLTVAIQRSQMCELADDAKSIVVYTYTSSRPRSTTSYAKSIARSFPLRVLSANFFKTLRWAPGRSERWKRQSPPHFDSGQTAGAAKDIVPFHIPKPLLREIQLRINHVNSIRTDPRQSCNLRECLRYTANVRGHVDGSCR